METKTETRYIVRTHDLPHVTVDAIEWERDTCHLGLYETEEQAWRAAEEHVLRYLRDAESARRIMLEELEQRIDTTKDELQRVRRCIHYSLMG